LKDREFGCTFNVLVGVHLQQENEDARQVEEIPTQPEYIHPMGEVDRIFLTGDLQAMEWKS
jgi:hypothetical protein